jgi:hypothetical protein
MGRKRIELEGKTFERLTVIEYVGKSKYKCLCVCGKETFARQDHLMIGATRSCGCLQSEEARERIHNVHENMRTHSMSKTRLYKIWQAMKWRCKEGNEIRFPYHAGKKIKVCKEWSSFIKFLEWSIINGYEDDLTIDRIDGDQNYNPDNCRWVDMQTQNENRSQSSINTRLEKKLKKHLDDLNNTYDIHFKC